jgi:hypothetical protein
VTEKVNTIELGEIIDFLPDIAPFKAQTATPKRAALIMCALGFEDRCVSVASALKIANYKCDRAMYFEYDTNREDNESNRPALVENLSSIGEDVQPLEAYGVDLHRHMREILEAAVAKAGEDAPPIVLFDISVASNRLIMRCMKVLLEFRIRLVVLYAEAAIYYPSRDEYERDPDRWCSDDALGLESGVRYVHTSEQYPGYHIDQLPDCVIVFPSFRPERSRAVISTVDPSLLVPPSASVLWMLGKPHLSEDDWRIQAMRSINKLTSENIQYEVSTFDYKDSLRALDAIYKERSETARFTLSPTGSKMQAVGAAFSCYLHPDIRVVFSAPEKFNASHYSHGCKATWALDFNTLSDVREKLDRIGQIQITD